jgi:hypothetical protein
VLAAHGFIITDAPALVSGQRAYEIKFGENMPSLIVYGKEASDGSMPKNNFFLMKLCGGDENPCPDLPGASFTSSLPFSKVSVTISDDEAEKQFTEIATEIVYAFNLSKI